MDYERVAASLAAIREYGGQRSAAAALGRSRESLRRDLTWAKINAPYLLEGTPMPDFTAPSLPPDDEDTINRLAAEQVRRQAYRSAIDWMRFTVEGDKPFALAFVGDPHIDVCDIITLRRDIQVIQRTPRMWAVGLGDWINGWVGKLCGQYAHQTVTEKQAYTLAKWLLNVPDIWWLLIWGNHDGQRWHGEGSPLKWMENAAAVSQEWACKFSIGCGGRVWRVSAAHNFPGNSMYNVGHGPKKRALMTGAEADIFVAGDRHTFTMAQDQHEFTGKIFWTVRARGYKPLDHYALEHGHSDAGGEQGIGHSVVAVFDPRDGSVLCFADVRKAAAFLGSIQDGVVA